MKNLNIVLKKMIYILNCPQKILCVLVFMLTCVGSFLECLGVSIIIPMVNVILNPEKLFENSIVQRFHFLRSIDYETMVAAVVCSVIVVYLLKNGFFIFLSWVRIKFSCKIQREMSIRMMESYMSRGYQFFLQKNYGELNRGVSGDTSAVYGVLNAGFRFISDLLTIFLICLFMLFADWSLSLMMVATSFICVLLIYFVFRRNMYKAGIQYRNFSARAGQAMVQAFQGIKDVLILRKQRYFIEEYEENQAQVQMAQCKQTVGQESPAYIIEGLCVSGLMIVVAMRVISGESSADFIAILAAFAVGAFRILPSLGRISISLNQVLTNTPSINAVYEDIIEAEEYARLHPEADFVKTNSTKLIAKNRRQIRKTNEDSASAVEQHESKSDFQSLLELKNISFHYNEDAENILEHINLEIKRGQAIALIGASGAGKSTLIDILLGLLVPQEGKILLDGTDITEIPDAWSKIVGYVPQSVFLSSDSIKKNVAFGEDENEINDALVREALERAELWGFIKELPKGMNTQVGDRGVRLSGGQRQRIAIARALYHKPEILVLDEATSALDNETESAIMSAIDSLQGQVTMIIVAHRLTTVRNCDVIYEVADKGVKVRDKKDVLRKV